MPIKISLNEKNKQMAIDIINKLSYNVTYEEIAQEYNVSKTFIYCLIKTYKPVFGIEGVISKYDALKLSGEINNVVKDYLNNTSTVEIGKKYNVSDRTVISWLIRENIPIRDRGKVAKVNHF